MAAGVDPTAADIARPILGDRCGQSHNTAAWVLNSDDGRRLLATVLSHAQSLVDVLIARPDLRPHRMRPDVLAKDVRMARWALTMCPTIRAPSVWDTACSAAGC